MKKYLAIGMVAALLALPGGVASAVAQNNSLQAIVSAATVSSGTNVLSNQIQVPERYTATAANPSGTITLTADAQLVVPDASVAPVLRVRKTPITQAQVDVLIQQLVKGELCSMDAYVPSKAQIQRKLYLFQKALDNDEPAPKKSKPRATPDMLKSEIADLNVQMQSASDEPRLMPISGQLAGFHRALRYAEGTYNVSQYETGEELNALAYSEAGYETFLINNSDAITNSAIYSRMPEDFAQSMGYYATITEDTDLTGIPPMTITEAQARQAAEAVIQALGIKYLDLARAEKTVGGDPRDKSYGGLNPRRQAWLLRYTRTVQGIRTTYSDFECMKVETDDQADPIMYESMTFAVDDSGVVGFQWSSPYEITGTVTEGAKILSFKDCASVFETMVFPVNEWMAENGSATIQVKQVKLGLSRVTERDVRGEGLLIPVWDFTGDVVMTYDNGGKSQQMKLEDWNLLTVNAVNGDVIDRNLGY